MIWANIESYKYNVELNEIEKSKDIENNLQQKDLKSFSQNSELTKKIDEPFDKAINKLKPLEEAGKRANSAIKIFITGIIAGLCSMVFMIIPNIAKKGLDNWVSKYGYEELDLSTIKRYQVIALVLNILMIFFQFMGDKGYFDFATTIASAFK